MAFHVASIHGLNAVGDVFQFGFGVEDASGTTQDVADAIATAWAAQFSIAHAPGGSFANFFAAGTSFTKVAVYRRSKTPGGPADELAEAAITGTGGGSTKALPAEAAVCVSLLTGVPGRSARGRMYLPAPRVEALANNGTMNLVDTQTAAYWAAAFFGDINTLSRHVVLWSRKNALSRNITAVSVGNQVDVQRRRQNSLPETYTSVNVSQV